MNRFDRVMMLCVGISGLLDAQGSVVQGRVQGLCFVIQVYILRTDARFAMEMAFGVDG